ncbi:uncharacterized protein FN964_004442 isoform 2-T3 [Alca torda]
MILNNKIQKEKMKMRKAIPVFVLLFTETTTPSHSVVPTSKVTQAPKSETTSETTPYGNDHHPEGHHSTIVAAISISVMLFFLLLIGVLYARKRRSSAEIDPVPSGEPGMYLERISTHEN